MNDNLTVDNDLQRAIDNITNTTNSDPVFTDPVAAPEPIAPVQETITEEAVSMSDPVVEPTAPAPEPVAPMPESSPYQEPAMPTPPEPIAPETAPTEPAPYQEPASATPNPSSPDMSPIDTIVESTSIESVAPVELATSDYSVKEASAAPTAPTDINEIKAAALNDLTPILNEVVPHLKDANVKPFTKFKLYKKIITELGDKNAIGSAYETANQIEDDKERSEALLSLVEIIDQM